LAGDQRCDVLVLGAGVTGALLAYRLAREGVDVVLVDRRDVGRGSTAASTGLLQYEIDTPLVDLIEKVGRAHAVAAYRRGVTAIDEIEQLIDECDDRCGFRRRETLYFASSAWHRGRLFREYECRREFGFDVDLLSRAELSRISTIAAAGAIRSRGDAVIDPLRFTQHLVVAARRQGARFHPQTIVTTVDEGREEVLVRTESGTVRCRAVVYAVGYDSQPHLDDPVGTLHSTYAVASRPKLLVPGWPDECLIWETARPYFYARRTDGRAIIGGADTAFANDHDRDALVERNVARLVKRCERLFPAVDFDPEIAWAGSFGETRDGLAYIGRPPRPTPSVLRLGLRRQRHHVWRDRGAADYRFVRRPIERRRRGLSLRSVDLVRFVAVAGRLFFGGFRFECEAGLPRFAFSSGSSGDSAGPPRTSPVGRNREL
jgi:glycine/D-amino acid oxidase-like deaminating enzyme